MQQTSHSILGRLAKTTAVGCLLALACLASTSVQSKSPAKARPFKAIAIYTAGEAAGTFQVVGNATHLGEFVGQGTFEFIGMSEDGLQMFLHVEATWTAANGDTMKIDFPWVADYGVTPPTSSGVGNIIGGTGRFANATGSFFADISPANITPGILNILTGEGTISY